MKHRKDPALTGRGTRRQIAPTPPTRPASRQPARPRHVQSAPVPRGLQDKIVWRRIDDLKPFPGNPRRHPEAQIAGLMRSIKQFWSNPILIDETGIILAGHARLAAARCVFR
jgi:hypothetical protein